MLKTKVKLLQRVYVDDGYGGQEEVYNYLKDITGYFLPNTDENAVEGARIAVNTTTKFISDLPVTQNNVVVEYESQYYDVSKTKQVYKKGTVLELKCNG